ncbi:sulfite exporter TauE/SafE family protein [Marinifilum flexuosum]|uniref:sulfite exporter TauE/SafE family protein n=1 Tax=Marinifilum flexuosum TaxID=1117708 RepID=UPI002491F630|nr:sulfite exporter TauE/SafE family protein [Marinifilum flexuosum]
MPNIYIFLTVIISSLIKGVSGFGFALISLPILLTWYPPKEIIPVLMICNLVASVFIILQKKNQPLIDKASMSLIVSGGIFTLIGVLVLKHVNANRLVHFSGVVFLVITFLSFIKSNKRHAVLPAYVYPIVGAIIGTITGIISISGPPLALFLNRANVDNKQFREIFAWFSVVTAVIAIAGYYHVGWLTPQALKLSLLFSPILLAGTIVGKYFNGIIPIKSFRTINILLTLISCFLLLIR